MLDAGRTRNGEPVDRVVGLVPDAKVRDRVQADDRLSTVHANDRGKCEAVP